MNYLFTFLILLVFILKPLTSNAQQYTLSDNDVEVINGVIQSCSYNFLSKDIIIPEILDGQEVIEIADKSPGVFAYKNITNVVLPNSIETIGYRAFCGNRITNLILPNKITTIRTGAFDSNSINNVTLPESLTSIGDSVFQANALTTILIPNSVTTIGIQAFSFNPLTSVNIPNSVTTIKTGAFNYCSNLSNVILPNGITTIESGTFNECRLTSVTIPNSVRSIESGAFYNNALTSLVIPNGVTSIGRSAFRSNSLTSVIIPNSVVYIAEYAFWENHLLSSIILPTPIKEGYEFLNWLSGDNYTYNGGDEIFYDYYRSFSAQFDVSTGVIDTKAGPFRLHLNQIDKNLTIENTNHIRILKIELFNLSGETQLQLSSTDKQIIRINLSSLKNGIFILKVIDENGQIFTSKLIK